MSTLTVPAYSWSEAVKAMNWRPGQHVTLIGPTDSGKTELMIRLLELRKWVVFFNTKRFDSTQSGLTGYRTIRTGAELNPEIDNHYVISPSWSRKLSDKALEAMHKREYENTLNAAFWQQGWTVAIDELEYLNRDLGIEKPVNKLFRQGRSQGNSMVTATQRPRYVTLHAYEQADHLFLWRMSDMGNIQRAAELSGVNKEAVMSVIPQLDKHDALYVNTGNGEMFVTNTRWE